MFHRSSGHNKRTKASKTKVTTDHSSTIDEKQKSQRHHCHRFPILLRRSKQNPSTMTSTDDDKHEPFSLTERETLSDLKDTDEDVDGTTTLKNNLPNISIERSLEAKRKQTDGSLVDIQRISRLVTSDENRTVYTVPENLKTLEDGGCLFSFVCDHDLTDYEAEMVDSFLNLSAFDDEEKENYVPKLDYATYKYERSQHGDPVTATTSLAVDKYTFLLARCGYLLPGVDIDALLANPTVLATLDYQRACQPDGTKIWDDYDLMEADTFRISKPIIPYIYSFTIQFRVSAISDPLHLERFSRYLGIRVDGGILMERTKRSHPPKEDSTKKCKSVLLYSNLGQGVVLCTHLTCMVQFGLPEVVERIIGSIGQWGLKETAETAWKTRRYLQRTMPFPTMTEPTFFLDATSEEAVSEPKQSDDDDDDDFFDAVDGQ
jgi:hypothetical protein